MTFEELGFYTLAGQPDSSRDVVKEVVEAEALFRQRLQAVTAGNPDGLVVFYCRPDCWMSWNAARRAAAMGFRAGWYPDGVQGWEGAGLPTAEAAPEPVE